MAETIGFIGLGQMGRPMAEKLINKGFPLIAFDINPQVVGDLAATGARGGESVADVSHNSDIIITMLPADEQIRAVYLAEGGVLAAARPGTICVDMTSAMGRTITDVAEEAKRRGLSLRFLDAPVSGGVAGAANGTLTIMAGGDRALIEECRPVLESMGRILYAGDLGAGKSVKTINQFLNAANTCAAIEAFFLAKRLGLDAETLLGIVNQSSGASWVSMNNLAKYVLTDDFSSGFRLSLMAKDVRLFAEQARGAEIDLPLARLVLDRFNDTLAEEDGNANYNIVARWIERHNAK